MDDFLAEGQRQISARNGAAAATAFERVLADHPNEMRATYGLAVASALQGQPERARELFAKVIAASQNSPGEGSTQADPSNVSWSHIYLGRMYDVEGQRDLAVIEYRAALSVAGVPESARAAAQRGVDTGYQTPSRDAKPDGKVLSFTPRFRFQSSKRIAWDVVRQEAMHSEHSLYLREFFMEDRV